MVRDILYELEEILNRDEFIDNDEMISAYSIYKILERYFDNVFFEAYDNYDLVSKINNSYTNREIRDSRKRGFDSPYLKILDIRSNVFNPNRKRNEIQITFAPFGPENRKYTPKRNVLYREKKGNIYGVKYKDGFEFCDSIWSKYYDDVTNIFDVCDDHSNLLEYFKDINSIHTITLDYNIYTITIAFNYFGNVTYDVHLKNDIGEISTKDFSEIRNIINNKKEALLRNSYFNINELDIIFRNIISDDLINKGETRTRKI